MIKDIDLGLLVHASATPELLEQNAACIAHGKKAQLSVIGTATWFLPEVTHALRGGVRTVFAVAEQLSQNMGTLHSFVMYSRGGVSAVALQQFTRSLHEHFPDLRFTVRCIRQQSDAASLPPSDIGICTLWTTAYVMLWFNQTRRKFYFAQDFEPMFYEGGSVYLAIEQTYRFGYSIIANTPGVASFCKRYTTDVVSFLPGVDTQLFRPMTDERKRTHHQIVFYGRPANARNCFDLGTFILCHVKRILGDRVRIVSVGAEWNPVDYRLEGIVENLGLLKSMDEVASLYRDSDLGLVFMATPHPSYQPLEYMASGCIVATNRNEANSWLLNDDNALLLEPIVEVAARRIVDLLANQSAMQSIKRNALKTIAKLSWEKSHRLIAECLVDTD